MILDNKVLEYGYDPTGGNDLVEEDTGKRNNIALNEDSDKDE